MAAFLLPSLNWSSAPKFTCFVVCICTLVISFSIYTLVHCKSIWSLHTGKFVDSFSIMHSQPFRIIRSSLNISLWIKLWINYQLAPQGAVGYKFCLDNRKHDRKTNLFYDWAYHRQPSNNLCGLCTRYQVQYTYR